MNERKKRFCEEYATSLNATQAAIRAGYSPRSAYSQGQRMLKNAEVDKYLRELAEKERTERIADAQEVLERLTGILRSQSRPTDVVRAAGLLLKVLRPARGPSETAKPDGAPDEVAPHIILPYDGINPQTINAVTLGGLGDAIPLAGHEADGVWIVAVAAGEGQAAEAGEELTATPTAPG